MFKFGQMEYELGSTDRARTVFEGVLASFPKRVDLWSVYLDKEIKFVRNPTYIRRLFDRVTSMKFTTKQLKFFFKKYMSYESEHGDETTIQHVRDRVQEFVNSVN